MIVLLLIITIIFFFKAVTLQGMFYKGDIILQFYPGRIYVTEAIKNGLIPLWSPEIYCGFPLLAEGNIGSVFYPLNIISLFLPGFVAFNYLTIFHYFLTGFFVFLYTREINLDKMSCFISSIIFTFSGVMLAHLQHISILGAVTWIPLLFYLIEKLIKGKNYLLYLCLLIIIYAIQIFSGHIQIQFYTGILLFFYYFYRVIKKEKKLFFISIFPLFILITAFLVSLQIFPTYELVKYSVRSRGVGLSYSTMWSFPPDKIWTIFYPAKILLNLEIFTYLGIIPLILTIFSFLQKNKIKNFFYILSLFSIFASFGEYSLLYKILHYLPGFSSFTCPTRFLYFFTFSFSITSGIGFNFLIDRAKEKSKFLFLLLIIIITFDLYYHSIKRQVNYISPEIILAKNEIIEYLKKDKEIFRIYNWGELPLPSTNLIYNIQHISGYSSLAFSMEAEFLSKGNFLPEKLWDLFNVKYLFIHPAIKLQGFDFEEIYLEDIKIYKNRKFLPRAFLVNKIMVKNKSEEILKELWNKDFNPAEYVILEENVANFKPFNDKKKEIKIIKYSPQEVLISVKINYPSFLVLTDTYYPGWKVYVDGKEEKIYRADYLFRGVFLGEGNHLIKFYFSPLSFKIGLFLSILTLISLHLIFYKILLEYKKGEFCEKNISC